jgi:hypothetical protein
MRLRQTVVDVYEPSELVADNISQVVRRLSTRILLS